MSDRDWDPDEEDWSETGGEYDADDSESDTTPCPACGAEIYGDLDHCPRCGHWLTDTDHEPFPSRRVRIVVIVVLILMVVMLVAETIGLF
jgi:uncharacterized paraquat-inducible protein A